MRTAFPILAAGLLLNLSQADAASVSPLDDPSLGAGFQKVERNADRVWRWTTGRARFPAALAADPPDGFFLRVELSAEALPRWIPPVGAEVRGATHGTQAA